MDAMQGIVQGAFLAGFMVALIMIVTVLGIVLVKRFVAMRWPSDTDQY